MRIVHYRKTIFVSTCFFISISAPAQTFPAPRLPQWWDGGQIIRIQQEYPQKLELIDAGGKRQRSLAAPPATANFWFTEGTAYAYGKDPKNRKEGILRQSAGLGGWQVAYRFQPLPGFDVPNQLYPLGEGRFLGFSEVGYWDGSKGSFFAVFKLRTDGRFEPTGLLDLGLKEPLFLKERDPRSGRPYRQNPRAGRLCSSLSAGDFHVFPAQDGVILGHFWTGCFFFVNSKGSLRRTVNLYSLSDAELGSFDTEVAVVDAQIASDGNLVCCARPEEAVKLGPKMFQTRSTLDIYQRGEGDLLDRRRDEALKTWPQLRWLKLDTEKGALTEITAPRGAPSQISDLGTFRKFRFNLLPDGRAVVLN